MRKIKDTDYLALSSRLRAMERRLLDRSRMERILDTGSDEEVAKLLQESGYILSAGAGAEELDRVLTQARREMLKDLSDAAPDSRFVDVFRMKYDYHNAKVVLKARAKGVDPSHMLLELGRVDPAVMQAALADNRYTDLPEGLRKPLEEAREVLETTGDPQLSDIALDRGYYKELLSLSQATGSAFLTGYARMLIDADNLRALVRTLRMKKGPLFLKKALAEGGNIAASGLLSVAGAEGAGLAELYATTALRLAAESGVVALNGGGLTAFEKRCDDTVGAYLAGAKLVAFGDAPLVGYLAARETEYTNLRILLLGRSMGLGADTVRERLREAYV